ncbi:MAG: Allantoicase [Piccolia ochrophora]|nr:MAG: Allantoicase [Piccolia ochrophora]
METESAAPSALSPPPLSPSASSTLPIPIGVSDIASTFSTRYIDLASSALTSRILTSSDEFFASAANLLNPTPPIHRPNTYISTGAWYDGWETRRHNRSPPDYAILRLGVASGRIAGVEVDTAFFVGNHAEAVSVQGCYMPGDEADKEVVGWGAGKGGWEDILGGVSGRGSAEQDSTGPLACGPSQRHAWALPALTKPYTHVRLCMHPDGGIARFRVYGVAVPIAPKDAAEIVDLAAAVNGGVAVAASNERFGPRGNVLLPGRGKDMGDGWETARSRGAEHEDWCVVKLGWEGWVDRVVVDTKDFKGNFPREVRVEGMVKGTMGQEDEEWVILVGKSACGPDREHVFEVGNGLAEAVKERTFGVVKLVMIPDGGMKRLRVFGMRKA